MNICYLSSDEVKENLLKILLAINNVCIANNLTYYLAFGTLLGAIRHEGFIPWDDDIDIWMPREDYFKFKDVFVHSIYKFRSFEVEEDFPLSFAKVCDPRFSAVDEFGKDFGLFVDIFPLDGLPDKRICQKFHYKLVRLVENLWSNQLFSQNLTIREAPSFSKKIKILIGKIIHPFMPRMKAINSLLDKVYSIYPFSSVYVSTLSYPVRIFKREWFIPAVSSSFEGHLFPVPHEPDKVLSTLYGDDFMQLPPMEKRITHGIKAYRLFP